MIFLCRPKDFREDSWTYGDWRQYLVDRPDGSIYCCRMSSIPYVMWLVGLVLGSFVVFALFVGFQDPSAVIWPRVIWIGVIAAIFLGLPTVLVLTNWTVMVSVGPRQTGRRIFPHEAED